MRKLIFAGDLAIYLSDCQPQVTVPPTLPGRLAVSGDIFGYHTRGEGCVPLASSD